MLARFGAKTEISSLIGVATIREILEAHSPRFRSFRGLSDRRREGVEGRAQVCLTSKTQVRQRTAHLVVRFIRQVAHAFQLQTDGGNTQQSVLAG